jgi:hypothetical protein
VSRVVREVSQRAILSLDERRVTFFLALDAKESIIGEANIAEPGCVSPRFRK